MASSLFNQMVNRLGSQNPRQGQSSGQSSAGDILSKISGILSPSQQNHTFQQDHTDSSTYYQSTQQAENHPQAGYGQWDQHNTYPVNHNYSQPGVNSLGYAAGCGAAQQQQQHRDYAPQGHPSAVLTEHTVHGQESYLQHSTRYPGQGGGDHYQQGHNQYAQEGRGDHHEPAYDNHIRRSHEQDERTEYGHRQQQGHGNRH